MSTASRASVFCPIYFDEPHVSVMAYQAPHGAFVPMELLPIKGLASLLEQYIATQIERGERTPVRFEIFRLGTPTWAADGSVPCLTRSAYVVSIQTRDMSLRNLVRLVEYSGSPLWQPFCDDSGDLRRTPGLVDQLEEQLDKLLNKVVGEPDLTFFAGRQAEVYRVGELAVIYRDGQLVYELAGEELGLTPQGFLPVHFGSRYVLQDGGDVVVLEAAAEVARYTLPRLEEDLACDGTVTVWAEVCAKWVNVACGSTAVLSYSAERHRFLRVHIEHHPWECYDRDADLGARWEDCN
jgi:hypothetical protein